MAVAGILLDTNAYVAFKREAPGAVEIIRYVPSIAISSIVLGELLSGFAIGTREAVNRQELAQFLASDRVRVLAVDDGTADHYAAVYRMLRRKGKPIPTNDMWLAAAALQHDLAVFSYDDHFQAVDGILAGSRLVDLG